MDQLYIIWQEEYNLGIPIIDEQHRGLVSTINSLYYNLSKGTGAKTIKPVFGVMQHYIDIHFATEEALMRQAGYPGYDHHIKDHKKLSREIREIEQETRLFDDPALMLKFLKQWWHQHINEEDREYIPWVQSAMKASALFARR